MGAVKSKYLILQRQVCVCMYTITSHHTRDHNNALVLYKNALVLYKIRSYKKVEALTKIRIFEHHRTTHIEEEQNILEKNIARNSHPNILLANTRAFIQSIWLEWVLTSLLARRRRGAHIRQTFGGLKG